MAWLQITLEQRPVHPGRGRSAEAVSEPRAGRAYLRCSLRGQRDVFKLE